MKKTTLQFTSSNESWTGEARGEETPPVQFPALDYNLKSLLATHGSKDPPLQKLV
jgi:hypothetical protein